MTTPRDDPSGAASAEQNATSTADPSRVARQAAPPLAPGAMLAGRFRIVAPLGRGAMGEVYRAEDLKLGQAVALKFLPEPIDEVQVRRFSREVRLGREVAHPNVCRIYDLMEADGRHFLAMEYVDGEDLASLLRRIGRLPADKALEIARGICAGLSAAHEKGILHRDLKPANVMIDGRGQPRLTDFGLAVLPGEAGADARAGTPAYMAPEQLQGAEATVRSDLYALGLVLYEMFTGRRTVEAGSISELIRRRADSAPSAPSSHVRDIDAGVERIILRCLERDPAARPASARAVLASFPGGDPLQAALALGETPSPQMVVAAQVVGDLQPRAAWACLGLGALLLTGAVLLADQVMLHRLVPLPKSPEVLLDRAKQIASALAPGPSVDSTHGFEANWDFLDGIAAGGHSHRRWRQLVVGPPGAIQFWYRSSPEPLVARTWVRRPPWALGVRVVGRVTRQQPPPTVPGMVEVVLDPAGRLVRFVAVPRDAAVGEGQSREPSLARLFAEAGLDRARLSEVSPAGLPSLAFDDRQAWTGEFADVPGRPIVVEEASLAGRPVFFEVKLPSPRAGAPSDRPLSETTFGFALRFMLLFVVLLGAGGTVLIVRNLRSRRGDLRGAYRLAAFGALTGVVALHLAARQPASIYDALDLWVAISAQAVFWAVWGWFIYVGLEPALRRTWPHALVSWSRVLAGRFRDPLVGRDVLFGVLAGLGLALIPPVGSFLSAEVGDLPLVPQALPVALLASSRDTLGVLLQGLYPSLLLAIGNLLLLLLLKALVRNLKAALLLMWLFFLVLGMAGADRLLADGLMAAAASLLLVTVLYRLGVLATALLFYVSFVLLRMPLASEMAGPSLWYAASSLLGLAVIGGLMVYGFLVSLGGKPVFGRRLLEE